MKLHSLLAGVALFAACATTETVYLTPPPAELTTAAPALLRAWQGDDISAFSPYYAENVVVVTPTDRYTGWADVRGRWITPGLPVISDFNLSNVNFSREGNDIIETGRYTYIATQDGRSERMRGSYAQRWQRQTDGSWRVVSVNVQ